MADRQAGSQTEWPDGGALGPSIEDSVVGTWFARIGVLAVLIGAAFGYRYAVDQGWIVPVLRVMLGAAVGLGFIGAGHWSRGRQWHAFSSATSGGGIAILYLSVLAASERYDLIDPGTALFLLTCVALASAALSIAYDSLALAVLATVGAFLNPFFITGGNPDPSVALSYVVGIDVGIVALAYFKRWPSLSKLALIGSAAVYAIAVPEADLIQGLGFATILWLLFTIVPYMQVARDGTDMHVTDVALVVSTGFLYFSAGMYVLIEETALSQGVFTLVEGLLYGSFAALALTNARTRGILSDSMAGLALSFITLSIPIMFDGPVVELVWSVEGTLLLWLGGRARDLRARLIGFALLLLGLAGATEAVAFHAPDRLLLSGDSLAIAGQLVTFFVAAWLLSRLPDLEEWERACVPVLGICAHLLALGWLTQETTYEIRRNVSPDRFFEVVHFSYSALWATYSALMFVIGVVRNQPWARYVGVGLFGLTIVKMVSVDLWELEILHRMIAFLGLGALLLACSLMYNRMRDLVVRGAIT
ncbi:MAG: DUF2339 domain-containing protein [Actinomycetota bacterium]